MAGVRGWEAGLRRVLSENQVAIEREDEAQQP